jgi:hypothetical protein
MNCAADVTLAFTSRVRGMSVMTSFTVWVLDIAFSPG